MADPVRVHATAVALDGQGVLITGPSGSGKSSLALELMAFGCQLIADDQTELTRRGETLWAAAPASIKGLIEARGVGLLHAVAVEAEIVLVIDLERVEKDRLPHHHSMQFLGLVRPCLNKVQSTAWPAAILQYLRGGIKGTL